MSANAINYTQGYIDELIEKAEQALGEIIFNYSQAKATGVNSFDLIPITHKIQYLTLLHKALCAYEVGGSNNCITDEQRDYVIEEILKLIGCIECQCNDVFGGTDCISRSVLCSIITEAGFHITI